MSRLGKLPVSFDSKVKADLKGNKVTFKGPNGEMSYEPNAAVTLKLEKEEILVQADFEIKEGRMMGGTARAIIKNMVEGVTTGFTSVLNLIGVGYRAQVQGQKLTLNLGFSHPIEYQLPANVKGQVDNNTKITLSSCDKQVLGQVCAELRKYRPPEPYKGKGIHFEGEVIRRKAGKSGKGAK